MSQAYLRYSSVGLQFAFTIALMTYGGMWADKKLGTDPLLTLLGLAFGFAAGFYHLYFAVYGRPSGRAPKDVKGDDKK